jgi:glucans biosynthesis protein C
MVSQTELITSQLPGAAATAPPSQAAAAPGSKRLLFIDNLRILLICGVLVVHLNDTYGALGAWEYHDPGNNLLTGIVLSIPNAIGMACGMGFFFLLAGYFTPGAYDRKGGTSFVRDRLVRLLLPLLLYELLIQPLVVYLAGGLPGSYWSFYGTFLLQMRAITGVVWFLAVLLLFDLLYAAWRGLTRQRRLSSERLGTLPSSPAIAVFIFALGLVSFAVRIWWPLGWTFQQLPGLEIAYLPQYSSLYILGLVASRRNWFFTLTPRMARNWSLIILMATLLILGGLVVPAMLQAVGAARDYTVVGYAIAGGFNWLAFGYALWEAFMVVGVGMGLLVLFRQRWNHQGRLARSLAPNVYLVYLIHAPVLIGFAYAFHVVALYPLLKWAIAVLVTIPLCFLISGVIRKIPLVNRAL